jgi:phosphoglycolate phosphatase
MEFPRHVVFDLDGTLVDSLPGIQWSVEAALAEAGIPMRHRNLKALIGPPIRQILAELSGVLNGPALDRLERSFRASYDSAGWRRTACQKGAATMLRGLAAQGVSLWLVTNKPAAATGRILGQLALAGFFTETVCRDSRAPAFESKAEMLMDLLRRRGLRSTETLMVGDTLEDARAAEAAGLACGLVPHGYGRGLDGPLPAHCRRIRGWSELLLECAARSETSFAAPMRLGELLI